VDLSELDLIRDLDPPWLCSGGVWMREISILRRSGGIRSVAGRRTGCVVCVVFLEARCEGLRTSNGLWVSVFTRLRAALIVFRHAVTLAEKQAER
jgi:hypothetical protein